MAHSLNAADSASAVCGEAGESTSGGALVLPLVECLSCLLARV
jgi:hypothetical protein